ncbi:SgcJ/EcaC family oxidoreductase [Catenulispora sp. NF23]|uniref:SgcJ/EcaC family oxidoreductase n=1 Tax=Catenulispora pinistramenti TaxID=2705254 RepID=A0ABS5KSX3_9ACTN|nr:SgcJ/EcaC family oxidoreductase [Catenulispora pinistramenti]MBS2537853.1 SgcJ/EcaC family oxidoreductase [Catenulispora pinistramenti]MBS2549151.1 SgcJ/EcaC family oxidoreductase [Catenulispora pinistramenti]
MTQTTPETAADTAAVHALVDQLEVAWSEHDAKKFADLFAPVGTVVLPGDILLDGRAHIQGFMAQAYQGPYKGTKVTGRPLVTHFHTADTAIMVTEGGVLAPGETEVAPQRAIRATWVCVRLQGKWLLAAYQNSPLNVPAA